ncbi:rhomboid family intramembrane serine protease [Candidatus Bathyarchaeota archaeon]|nr:MAG: rhomboid family intramembrane serine protease [Candidatus Bathyarchaeota archaeon]TMI59607.1 MAG: rhomboid family intramembrane serine protease [Candidatus Bathyarchaeota archaeon]
MPASLVTESIQASGKTKSNPYLTSPTLVLSLLLICVYVAIGFLVGDFVSPLLTNSPVLLFLAQCDGPLPIYPWTLVTSIFLHANIIHIASNILFLLLFGFILEEQVTKTRWMTTFFLTGIMGNLTFVGADLAGFFITGFPNSLSLSCGVGASGAVYGIMGAATGIRGVVLIIFIAGLDIFAGGGFFAHIGGLVTGLVLRKFWSSELKNF